MKKSEMPKKQREAWEVYAGFKGTPEDTEVDELLRGIPVSTLRHITKFGGYKEIPSNIIEEAAESVGVPFKDLPLIEVSRVHTADEQVVEGGKHLIRIPRRLDKRRVPETLRHELAHFKLEHSAKTLGEIKGESGVQHYSKEIEADKLSQKKFSWRDLVDLIFTSVVEDGLTWREAISVIREAAENIGISSKMVKKAVEYIKNYLVRYDIDINSSTFPR